MEFEAYRISERNYQIYHIEDKRRQWLASFNSLANLLNYYIFCHNMTFDEIKFTGTPLNKEEQKYLNGETDQWHINQ